jgi:hypothetical protein
MDKIGRMRTLTGIFVLCFLCCCILSRTIDRDSEYQKASDVPSKGSDQVPDEEQSQEKAERDFDDNDKQYKVHANLFLLYVLVESQFTFSRQSNMLQTDDFIRGCKSHHSFLYLVNRTLLI